MPASRIYRQQGDPWYTALWKQPIKYWWVPPFAIGAIFYVGYALIFRDYRSTLVPAGLFILVQLLIALARHYLRPDERVVNSSR